jgi:hypothetical protein
MSVNLDGEFIRLVGDCTVEDAEPLLGYLMAGGEKKVDLRQSGHLHTAVVQVLLAREAKVIGPAGDRFVQAWLLPLFEDALPIAN